MTSIFSGKTILVTGATGSIGSEIVRQLLSVDPKVLRLYSRDEHKHFLLQKLLGHRPDVRYLLGDIRDAARLVRAMEGVDLVFHCAAYKHVPLCEYNSFEAVKTNVIGTQNVIEAALHQDVKRVLLVSTDKAASPTNVMGATKLLAEKLMTSAMDSAGPHGILFSSVRFGNVLNSRGSVLPTFTEQIRAGGPVTITHPGMTRFFMSIPQAVSLTFRAMELMECGELFVLKMPVAKLGDLAEVLVEELAPTFGHDPARIERCIVGMRPGERMHETLMTEEESHYATETDDMFVVRSPLHALFDEQSPLILPHESRTYSSQTIPPMKREELRTLLRSALSERSFWDTTLEHQSLRCVLTRRHNSIPVCPS